MITALDTLTGLRERHAIYVKVLPDKMEIIPWVEFHIGQRSWKILVNDEYKDLNEKTQLMCLFLVLRELENYLDASDYLKWCNHLALSPDNDLLLKYYRNLGTTIQEVESIIGPIDSQITSLDYQLRTSIIKDLIAAG